MKNLVVLRYLTWAQQTAWSLLARLGIIVSPLPLTSRLVCCDMHPLGDLRSWEMIHRTVEDGPVHPEDSCCMSCA